MQPAMEDSRNLAWCLVNYLLQFLLASNNVSCLMEGVLRGKDLVSRVKDI